MTDPEQQQASAQAPLGSAATPRNRRGRVVEILISLGVTALIVSLVLPSLNRMRESSGRLTCPSNLRRIGQALQIYADEHGGVFPPTLEPLLKDLTPETFVCPSSSDTPARGNTPEEIRAEVARPGHVSYVYVGAGLTYTYGSDHVVAYDRPGNHAPDGANVVFADCHVDWVPMSYFKRILEEVAAGRLPVRLSTIASTTTTAPATQAAR